MVFDQKKRQKRLKTKPFLVFFPCTKQKKIFFGQKYCGPEYTKKRFFVFRQKNGFAPHPSKKSIVHGTEKMKFDFFQP
jgi:hypothetical protein